jgi:hypothetical protein
VVRIRLVGRLAVVSEGTAGVELWDLTNLASPTRAAHLAAPNARDAVLSGGEVVIADGNAVTAHPLPAAAAGPAGWIDVPSSGAELVGGQGISIGAIASGVGLDDVQLWVNGSAYARLDEAAPGVQLNLPASATPGGAYRIQLVAFGPGGRRAASAERIVRVAPPAAATPPDMEIYSPYEPSLTSGAIVLAEVYTWGGVEPSTVTVRWGDLFLGELDRGGQYYWAEFRFPVVQAETTADLVFERVDAAGSVVTRSQPLTIFPDQELPDLYATLPEALWVNESFMLSAWGDDESNGVIRILVNGEVVASSSETWWSWNDVEYVLRIDPAMLGRDVVVRIEAEDFAGNVSFEERTYRVTEAPPFFELWTEWEWSDPVAGYPTEVCVLAYGESAIATFTAELGGLAFDQPPQACEDPERPTCVKLCRTVALSEGEVQVTATATNVADVTASTSLAIDVAPNEAPFADVRKSYLVLDMPTHLALDLWDERMPLDFVDVTIGEDPALRLDDPYEAYVPFTATSESPVSVTVVAQDMAGLASEPLSVTLPVAPAGTGATCESAWEIPLQPYTTSYLVAVPLAAPVCGGEVTNGTWVALPFDGPVESVTMAVAVGGSVVATQDGCGSAVVERCEGTTYFTGGPFGAGARVLVAGPADGVSDPLTYLVRANLGVGAKCDPVWASYDLRCPVGTQCSPSSSDPAPRCRAPECGDGVDNDEDGVADAADSGCGWAGDPVEDEPAHVPACSNELNDDLDAAVDYPSDPECRRAAGDSEQFCASSVPVAGSLGGVPLPITVSGSTAGAGDFFRATCASTYSSDHVYEFRAPRAGAYAFDTFGSAFDTVLYVRGGTCNGAELPNACSDDYGGRASFVQPTLTEGQVVAIVVDGYGSGSVGAYTLNVRATAEAGFCTGGRDEDRDGAIDCADTDCGADAACAGGQGGSSPRRGSLRRRRRHRGRTSPRAR